MKEESGKIGPLIFFGTLVVVLIFFWWFSYSFIFESNKET